MHRLLGQLIEAGAVRRDGVRYRLDVSMLGFGAGGPVERHLRAVAGPPMVELTAGTGAAVSLTVAFDGEPRQAPGPRCARSGSVRGLPVRARQRRAGTSHWATSCARKNVPARRRPGEPRWSSISSAAPRSSPSHSRQHFRLHAAGPAEVTANFPHTNQPLAQTFVTGSTL